MTRRVGIFPSCCAWHDSIHAKVGYGVVVRLPGLRSEYTAIDGGAAAVIQPGQSVIAGN
jgi:hypothetical protein